MFGDLPSGETTVSPDSAPPSRGIAAGISWPFSLLAMAALLIASASPLGAAGSSHRYWNALKKGGFGDAMSRGTTLTLICRRGSYEFVFYDNVGPESGHEYTDLVVLKDGAYAHDYSGTYVASCGCSQSTMICTDTDGLYYKIPIADIVAGRRIFIGRDLICPWKGNHPLHRGKCTPLD